MEFKVSAPGKLILYGEHSVVYGKTAVAAALDLRTTLKFQELPLSDSLIHLCTPTIHLDTYIPILQILEYFSVEKCPKFKDNHEEFYNYIKEFVHTLEFKNNQQKMGLEALMYLLIAINQIEGLIIKPFKLTTDTALAISSGLGSSASFAVCICTAFLHWSYCQRNEELALNDNTLAKISQYTFNCERIMHGSPSGVDNSICTYGSMIEFRKSLKLQPISGLKSMKVLLVDTRVQRSTKDLMLRLATLKNELPSIFDRILEAMDNVSLEALSIIKRIRDLDESEVSIIKSCYEQLMRLIFVNQGLLTTCQVSHPSLDQICAEAKKFGLAAKLTGAGGGGYAYILLLPDTPEEIIENISQKLVNYGYIVSLTSLGGAGVQIN